MGRLLYASILCALAPAHGHAQDCRLGLLLAIDVSASIDAREFELQRNGYVDALTSPEVRRALLAHPGWPVAISAFEFSGQRQQAVLADWRLILADDDIDRLAAELRASKRSQTEFPTAIGYALGFASVHLRAAPRCREYKIDLSADGENNDGFPPTLAYRHFPFAGVSVNALAIADGDDRDALAAYFVREVIRGPGAFVLTADGFGDFARALREKLLRELRTQVIGRGDQNAWPGTSGPRQPSPPLILPKYLGGAGAAPPPRSDRAPARSETRVQ